MPTILQLNTVVNFGSTGRIVAEIGQLARTNGWTSYIAFGQNKKVNKSNLIKVGTNWDIIFHGLQTRLFDRHGFSSWHATVKLLEFIKDIKPDIIHLHNIHGYYLNIELLFNYLSQADIPVVWTLHDCWPITGHCVYFEYIGCDKWKNECYQCPQKTTYPASICLDRSKKNYRLKKELFTSVDRLTIVPVSNWLGNIVRQSFLSEYPIRVIHNGIDIFNFKPQNTKGIENLYHLNDKFIILGVASPWSTRKGLSDFIELSKQLDSEYQIILVGLNKYQIKDLPENIIGISRTESLLQLSQLYSIADLFLNLTYEDNFPTTNIESLACGTPVLTYKTGGSVEAVTPDTGFIVEKGDLVSTLNMISIVKEKGKKYFSKACRTRAEKFYNKDVQYKEYIQLYYDLLNTKHNSTY